eukprot:378792-Prymnesium_polylepis.1
MRLLQPGGTAQLVHLRQHPLSMEEASLRPYDQLLDAPVSPRQRPLSPRNGRSKRPDSALQAERPATASDVVRSVLLTPKPATPLAPPASEERPASPRVASRHGHRFREPSGAGA